MHKPKIQERVNMPIAGKLGSFRNIALDFQANLAFPLNKTKEKPAFRTSENWVRPSTQHLPFAPEKLGITGV